MKKLHINSQVDVLLFALKPYSRTSSDVSKDINGDIL